MTIRFRTSLRLAMVGVLAAGCSRPQLNEPDSSAATDAVTLDSTQLAGIESQPAESTTFQQTVTTTGTVTFNGERSTQVISPISGPVVQLVARLGDRVQAGAVLATVSSPDFAQAIADYRRSDAEWRNANRIAKLDDQLLATGALPQAERDQAYSDLASAAADRDAARSALHALGLTDSAVTALDSDSTATPQPAIRAPIGGTVVERLVTPGQLLEAGSTATFTIADLGTVWVEANLFSGDLTGIRDGDDAVVTINASADSFPGKVIYVGALVNPESKATGVRLLVPNRGRALRQNMLVSVRITSAREQSGILVPVTAVLRDDENLPYLFVRQGPRQFARRRISLGERTGDRYQVTSGLTTGEEVVVKGGLYLSEAGAL